MVVHTIGIGQPHSIRPCIVTTQVLNCSCGLFYQVDRNRGSGKHDNSEYPEVLQKKHTSQVLGSQAIVIDN